MACMFVTDIEPYMRGKGRVAISLNDKFAFVLYKGDLSRYHLNPGEEVDLKEYEESMTEVLPKRALDRSYKLLMSRDYTVKQLKDKLIGDGYPMQIIDDTVEKLKSEKYLDDERFAENYIFWKSKTKSRKRMIMDLKQRGIEFDASSNVYDELLEKNDIDNEETIILAFLAKKGFLPESATYEEKQKMTQTLLRKGFSFDSIHNILGYSPFS